MRLYIRLLLVCILIAMLLLAGCYSSKSNITQVKKKTILASSSDSGSIIQTSINKQKQSATTAIRTNEESIKSVEEKIADNEYEEDVFSSITTSDTYILEEKEERQIWSEGKLYEIQVLVIEEADRRVKLKINDDISYGIKEETSIILKDEEDELIIEVIQLLLKEDSTYNGPKKVKFRIEKLE